MSTKSSPTCVHCQAPVTLLDDWVAVSDVALAHEECERNHARRDMKQPVRAINFAA